MPDNPAPSGADLQRIGVASAPTPGQGLALDERGQVPPGVPVNTVNVVAADPTNPFVGQIWYRSDTSQLCIRHDNSTTKRSAAFT